MGRRVGMVVVRRGQAAHDHLDGPLFRLPGCHVPAKATDYGESSKLVRQAGRLKGLL